MALGVRPRRATPERVREAARSLDLGRRDIGHNAEPGDAGMRSRHGSWTSGGRNPSPKHADGVPGPNGRLSRLGARSPNSSKDLDVLVDADLRVAIPYHRVQTALVNVPIWLAHLVPPAVAEALDYNNPGSSHGQRELLCRVRDAICCDVSSAQVAVDEILVPLRWQSELGSEEFPPVLDVELRAAESAHQWSRLSLRATYECPSLLGQRHLQSAVDIAADAYLIAVATWL
jgi:hypothetical protein